MILDPPVIMSKDGELVTVRTSGDYVRFQYDGWEVVGDGVALPAARPSVKSVNGLTGVDIVLEMSDIDGLVAALASVGGLDEDAVVGIVSGLLTGAPAAYDTLLEIANAMSADDSAAAALITTVAGKASQASLDAATARVTTVEKTVGNDWLVEKNLALRTALIALKAAETTAVDVLWGPSDSLGESAYVTAAKNRVTQLVVQKLRRIFQPSGVVGGYGYYGGASNVWVTGDPLYGATGTVTNGNTYGLGRKHVVLAPGATYIWKITATAFDTMFTTGPTGATYSIDSFTTDGVDNVVVTGDTNAVSLGHVKVNRTGLDGTVARYVRVTNTHASRSLYVEGIFVYNGDETKGIRMWEAAHAGYGIDNYTTSTLWADSLTHIPNLGLVILPIGSNDFYAGGTAAAAKTKIQDTITLIRTKTGKDPSIVLIGYYDRPAPAKVEEWSAWTAMYKEIADADSKVTFLDMVPVFGPKVSDTDNRDGLNYAADHVHFTDAGAELFASAVADFIVPKGSNPNGAPGLVSTGVQAAIDAIVGGRMPVYTGGNFAGAASFTTLGAYGVFKHTLSGAASLAPSGMPPVVAGKDSHWYWIVTQDATGGRALTLDSAIKRSGTFGLDTTAFAVTLLHFYYDGATWWVENMSNPALSTAQATAVGTLTLPNQGDGQAVYSAAFAGGAITLSAFASTTYGAYRLVLGGASSFSAAAKPTVAAGRMFTFRLVLVQDATGGRVVTWNANVLTAAGVDPVLSTAANAIDVAEFLWTGTELIMTNFIKGAA